MNFLSRVHVHAVSMVILVSVLYSISIEVHTKTARMQCRPYYKCCSIGGANLTLL